MPSTVSAPHQPHPTQIDRDGSHKSRGGRLVPPSAPAPSLRPSALRDRRSSECRAASCRLRPSLSRQAAQAEESTSQTTCGSRSCKGCPSDPSRTPPATHHPHLQHRGSPLPVDRLPKRVASECHKALLQASVPPIAGWPSPSAGESGPFALPALPGFIARTNPSVPAPCIGTRLLMGPLLGGLPWHQGTASHVPHKSLTLV